MKAIRNVILAIAFLGALSMSAIAADDGHNHKKSPKGGKLIDKTKPQAELVVEKDRTVTINFYTDDLKPVSATTQSATLIANAKDAKQTLQFEKKGDSLVSKGTLPEGDGYTVVLQFKETSDAKPMNVRFNMDLAVCGECKRAEYACVCEH